MLSFKKIVFTITLFVVLITVGSAFFIESFLVSDMEYYQDNSYRDSLSGTLDFLIVGSCQGKYAFVPKVIDKELNSTCYNLCGIHTSPSGEIAMLNEEIDRNPVKNVIIDINYDTLAYTTKGIHALGDITTIPRIHGHVNRIKYFFSNVHPEDYSVLYSTYLKNGYTYCLSKVLGSYESGVNIQEKGHWSRNSSNFVILEKDAKQKKQSETISTEIIENNDQKIEKMIKMCIDRQINVYLVMTPSTDNHIWTNKGWDTIHSQIQEIADKYDVVFIDFNLYKDKSKILHDENSFEGLWHLADEGSIKFTIMLTNVIKKVNCGEDISSLFYHNYNEVLANSRYSVKYKEIQS